VVVGGVDRMCAYAVQPGKGQVRRAEAVMLVLGLGARAGECRREKEEVRMEIVSRERESKRD
jgi:hypothetical protein